MSMLHTVEVAWSYGDCSEQHDQLVGNSRFAAGHFSAGIG